MTTALLESTEGKGENDRRKYFMINLHKRMILTSGGWGGGGNWTRDLLVSSRTSIQLSYRLAVSVLFVQGVNFQGINCQCIVQGINYQGFNHQCVVQGVNYQCVVQGVNYQYVVQDVNHQCVVQVVNYQCVVQVVNYQCVVQGVNYQCVVQQTLLR